jgi:hypothetical protein
MFGDRSKLPAKVDKPGYVYVVRDGDAYRVGMTTQHPSRRIQDLQCGNPRKLELFAFVSCNNPAALEENLHIKLASYRIHGDWYSLEAEKASRLKVYLEKQGG